MDIKSVLCASLDGLDEDMAQYIGNMLEDLSLAERQDAQCLFDTIGPFLMDADYADESAAKQICRGMSVMLGGGHDTAPCVEETPALLAAPVRISERPSQAANAPLVVNNLVDPGAKLSRSAGAEADAASRSESVHKHNRRLKKVSADSLRQVQEEAAAQAAARQEMAAARMAAILARRKMSRQAAAGVHLDRVSVPHPAGAGDIISDVSLSLSPNRIYGLIGRNGSGKSTLLRALASYKLPDIQVRHGHYACALTTFA